MLYRMQEKIFTLSDDYTIRNEADQDCYFVKGRIFTIGNKLSFQDMNGNELAFIAQKLMALKKTYEIFRDGKQFASVVKDWTFFRDQFQVDVPGPNDYTVKGNFIEHEFTFERSGQVVARVSKAFFSWSDSYGIEIIDGEDDIVILATSVVIDLILHERHD